jgi:hypothetical protein
MAKSPQQYHIAGMECTGSTLVWQFVTAVTGRRAKKIHHYVKRGNGVFFVSYRDPRDIMCSFAKRQLKGHVKKYGMEEALLKAFHIMFEKFNRHRDLIEFQSDSKQGGKIYLIKYEDYFCGNEHKLLNLLLNKMGKTMDEKKKADLVKKYSIEENKKRSAKFSGFGQYDKKTFIHGNHISADGKVGVWREVFTDKVRKLVKERLGQFLIDFGYEKDLNW